MYSLSRKRNQMIHQHDQPIWKEKSHKDSRIMFSLSMFLQWLCVGLPDVFFLLLHSMILCKLQSSNIILLSTVSPSPPSTHILRICLSTANDDNKTKQKTSVSALQKSFRCLIEPRNNKRHWRARCKCSHWLMWQQSTPVTVLLKIGGEPGLTFSLFCSVSGEKLLHSSLQQSDHKDFWSEEGERRTFKKEQVCSSSSSSLSCASVYNDAYIWIRDVCANTANQL